jgi:uridylate kinase
VSLQSAIEKAGVTTRVQTAIPIAQIAEPYIRRRAMRHLEKGRVVIFGAGTGNPFFTTDTAGALRAIEIEAEALLMAKNVDGVYDKDPKKHPDAKRFATVSFGEALQRNLKVMDSTAFALCQDNSEKLHGGVVVFELARRGNIQRVVCGEPVGTIVKANVETKAV